MLYQESLFVNSWRLQLCYIALLVKFKAYYQYSGLLSASTQNELPLIGSILSLTPMKYFHNEA